MDNHNDDCQVNRTELKKIILTYNFFMEIFKNDENNYTILLDYINNKLTFLMTNNEGFNITQYIICNKIEAIEIIDTIRNNFILNHDITLPQRGKMPIKFPDMNFYSYIMCHHLKNTKFDLIVTVRSKNDENRMNLAQEVAMKKHNKQMILNKKN